MMIAMNMPSHLYTLSERTVSEPLSERVKLIKKGAYVNTRPRPLRKNQAPAVTNISANLFLFPYDFLKRILGNDFQRIGIARQLSRITSTLSARENRSYERPQLSQRDVVGERKNYDLKILVLFRTCRARGRIRVVSLNSRKKVCIRLQLL